MKKLTGVQRAVQKDGKTYYRASITYNMKHISLGSYDDPETAHEAYKQASTIMNGLRQTVEDYPEDGALSFQKYIVLINLKNNGIYFKTPIYLYPDYFIYYLSPDEELKFDRDDLFFYSAHSIQKKGGYLFVSHYGSQYNILSRYGIHNFAVEGRDYQFVNGDNSDYRYENIRVLSHYMGVVKDGDQYLTQIHVNGNLIVGRYSSETYAAIAYNKAADILKKKDAPRRYVRNYIEELSSEEYHAIYERIQISDRIDQYQLNIK